MKVILRITIRIKIYYGRDKEIRTTETKMIRESWNRRILQICAPIYGWMKENYSIAQEIPDH